MRDARRTQERSSNDEIIRHLRRFGQLHTSQIANALGLSRRTLADKLPSIPELERECRNQKTYWKLRDETSS